MKNTLFYIAIILSFTNNYALASTTDISVFHESLKDDGSVTSIGIFSSGSNVLYAGVSLNYIDSTQVIQRNNRKTIYPLYLVIGLKAPWKISPYLEFAADLPEVLVDEYIHHEDDSINEIDYYYSAGITFSTTDKISFSMYAKRYNFIFRDTYLDPFSKTRLNSYGVGIKIKF